MNSFIEYKVEDIFFFEELALLIVLDLKSRRVEILWYFSMKNSLQIKLIL